MHEAVAAAGGKAVIQALVVIAQIGVIALLAGLNEAVATARQGASRGTLVGVVRVAVVAGLDPGVDVAVTTCGERAVVQTGVVIGEVKVITFLYPLLHEAVTTTGVQAARQASVGVT